MTQLETLEAMLTREIGLNFSSIGSDPLRPAIQRLADRIGANVDKLCETLLTRRQLLDELIEELVVPESWFFRDQAPFHFLTDYVESWRSANPHKLFRVLSAPCASGEEPYSIAMTLLDAGFAPSEFHVQAVDLSRRSLERARAAQYGSLSFRGKDLRYRDRYFERLDDRYHLRPEVRDAVSFERANLVSPSFLDGSPLFDVIFCRNVLIYLVPQARDNVTIRLDQLLQCNGVLLLGHADALTPTGTARFISHAMAAFAFRKRVPSDPKPLSSSSSERINPLLALRQSISPAPVATPMVRPQPPVAAANVSDPNSRVTSDRSQEICPSLSAIQKIADSGDLQGAILQCERLLADSKPTADAYYLFGVLLAAANKTAPAEESLHRAVYLNRDHSEALLHLALLADKRGDKSAAAQFRRRADNAFRRSETT